MLLCGLWTGEFPGGGRFLVGGLRMGGCRVLVGVLLGDSSIDLT